MSQTALYLASASLALLLLAPAALADHDDRKDKHHRDKDKKASALPAASPTYERECGACHWAFFPGLLPASSWDKILSQPASHFGEELPTSPGDLARLLDYLKANAADKSGHKRSRKIMKSIGRATPSRISEIAYLRDKHHQVGAEVFQGKAVGGFANCLACHPGAKSGDFDDDRVSIPR